MKKFYLFMLMLIASVGSALAQLPTFTAQDAPEADAKYYYISFLKQQYVLDSRDEGRQTVKLQFGVEGTSEADTQLFKFVGNEEGFEIISKNGRRLVFTVSRGIYTYNETPAANDSEKQLFRFVQEDDVLELEALNVENNGNWWTTPGYRLASNKGVGLGHDVTNWKHKSGITELKLIPESEGAKYFANKKPVELQTAFNKDAVKWYRLIFKRNGIEKSVAMQDMGVGNKMLVKDIVTDPADDNFNKQLFQVIGTDFAGALKLVTKEGHYVYLHEDRLKTADTDQDYTFVIENMPSNKPPFYQFRVEGGSHPNINPVGGAIVDKEFGTWNKDDGGNAFFFQEVSFEAPKPQLKVTATATGAGRDSWITFEGVEDGILTADNGKAILKIKADKNSIAFIKSIKINGTELAEDVLMKKEYSKELTVTEDTQVEVDFFYAPQISIYGANEYDPIINGTASLGNTTAVGTSFVAQPNAEVTVEVTPEEGYLIDKVIVQTMDANFTTKQEDITATMKFTVGAGASSASDMMLYQYSLLVSFKEVPKSKLTIKKEGEGEFQVLLAETGEEVKAKDGVYEFTTGSLLYIKPLTKAGDVKTCAKLISGDKELPLVYNKDSQAYEYVLDADATIKLHISDACATPVEEVASTLLMSVYPNPATEYVIIKGLSAQAQVRIINITGKTVRVAKVGFDGMIKINVENLAKGLYIVRSGKAVAKLQVR